MSESFWESGAAVESQPQGGAEPVHAEPGSLAVSADDFSGLENRVLKAIELVKRERQQRSEAEARLAQTEERLAQTEQRARETEGRLTQAEAQIREQGAVAERMQAELNALKGERDHVRQRIERLLGQLDGLEL
jgi:septal ring factor EnvC (AmiA/AmiB activator)